MKIKKLHATFGKLNGDTLELSKGLNIIRAPNESGKSTWCAFIRAMLYGINTSQRDKPGFIADKNKYAPWSGAPMSGEMELMHQGMDITISRSSLGSSPMKKFTAVYTGTAEPVSGLDGQNAGEILTGASAGVFDRTAFIRQAGIKVDQNSDLEKKIAALVSSGGETRSFSEANGDLGSWMRSYRYNKTGSIPKLEEQKKALQEKYTSLEQKTQSLSDLRQNAIRAAEQKEKLSQELELHKKIEKRNRLRNLKDAANREKKADEEIAALTSIISVDGHIPTKEEISQIRAKCSTMDSLNVLFVKSLEAEKAAKVAMEDAEKEFQGNIFLEKYGSEEAAASKASHIAGYTKPEPEAIPEPPKPKSYLPHMAAFIVLAIAGALLGVAGLSGTSVLNSYYAVCFAFAVLCIIFAGIFLNKSAREKAIAAAYVPPVATDPMEEYYEIFGTDDLEKLKSMANEFLTLRDKFQKSSATYAAARQSFIDAGNSVKAAENLVMSAASSVIPNASDPYSVLQDLVDVENKLELLTKARFEKLTSQNIKETLSENISDDIDVSENDFLPVPMYSYEVTLKNYENICAEYNELAEKYNIAYGELKALGDPVVILSDLSRIEEELKVQNDTYDSLNMAYTALNEANVELQTRFSPVISKKAGEYMSVLTGGRYSDIVFDKAFNAMAKSSEETISRSILSLSEGTADQIYLALRLAMSTLILDGDDPAPIILDDAIVNFDSNRMRHALRLLRKMSAQRQIILFTCHDREIEFAKNFPNVRIILFGDEDKT